MTTIEKLQIKRKKALNLFNKNINHDKAEELWEDFEAINKEYCQALNAASKEPNSFTAM